MQKFWPQQRLSNHLEPKWERREGEREVQRKIFFPDDLFDPGGFSCDLY